MSEGQLTAVDPAAAEPDPRRWAILVVVVLAQLMTVLDATIVTLALPSAQASLHFSSAERQWVVTAYALAFGGLLLLGGRVADFRGRRRMFITGAIGFAGASALGGLAVNSAMLFGARALQGAFAALMAPAALSILTITFQHNRSERAKAFGAYGAVGGAGGAAGLLAGGVLTQYASWRWCFLLNVPIALFAAAAAARVMRESRLSGTTALRHPWGTSFNRGSGQSCLWLHEGRIRRLGIHINADSLDDCRRLAHRLRRARKQVQRSLATAPSDPRPQPGWRISCRIPGRSGSAHHLRVSQLLPPGGIALLGDQDRARFPAILCRHSPGSHGVDRARAAFWARGCR